MYSQRLTVTHSGTDHDVTDDATDIKLEHEQREIAELSFTIIEPTIPKYKDEISEGDAVELETDGTSRFSGVIKRLIPEHSHDNLSYDVTARGTLINIAKRTTGHRKYVDKTMQQILQGWAGDAAWSADVGTEGQITLTSTSADDTQKATIIGTLDTFVRNEELTLTGTSAATSANTYDGILYIKLNSAAVGTITVRDAGSATIGTFSAGDDELCTSETDGTHTNYSNGLLYDSGFYSSFSSTPDYTIQEISFHHEYLIVSLDRLCDIGDSNGVWDYVQSGSVLNLAPRTDYTNSYDLTRYGTRKETDSDATVDRVILIGSKVQQSDGTWQEIVARASSGNGYEDMVVTDTNVTDSADAEQKASNVLSEYSSVQTEYEVGPFPINPAITINDRAYVRNPDSQTHEYKRIYAIEHDLGARLSSVKCGSRRTIDRTINVISGYDGIALYGSANVDNIDARRKYTDSFEDNVASGFDLTYMLDVPEEGIIKATLKLDGLKYRQYSAEPHYHDNAASYTVNSHTHEVGTYAGDSHLHADGTYAGDSHSHDNSASYIGASHTHDAGTFDADIHDHDYGTQKDTSQTHSLYSNYGSFAYKSHDHALSSEGGTDEQDGSDFPHSHDALTGSTDANTSGNNMYYLSSGITQSSSATLDSGYTGTDAPDVDGASGSTNVSISGSSGSTSVSISGSSSGSSVSISGGSGGSGATIDGNSGSSSSGAETKEDTYPSNVHITINGTDRTTALGGPWSDNFSVELDITDYVDTDGTHDIALSSDQNGRIRGKAVIYY